MKPHKLKFKVRGNRMTFQEGEAGPVGVLKLENGVFSFEGAYTPAATEFFQLLKEEFIEPYVKRRLGLTFGDVDKWHWHIQMCRDICIVCGKKENGMTIVVASPEKKRLHIGDSCLVRLLLGCEMAAQERREDEKRCG